jgi:hypothetical protein
MAGRPVNSIRETYKEYEPPKMTGQGNEEGVEDTQGTEQNDKSSQAEESSAMNEDGQVEAPLANSKGKRKGGSKSDSEPADDDSEKNIDDDVPLSFPQRVSDECVCVRYRCSLYFSIFTFAFHTTFSDDGDVI